MFLSRLGWNAVLEQLTDPDAGHRGRWQMGGELGGVEVVPPIALEDGRWELGDGIAEGGESDDVEVVPPKLRCGPLSGFL